MTLRELQEAALLELQEAGFRFEADPIGSMGTIYNDAGVLVARIYVGGIQQWLEERRIVVANALRRGTSHVLSPNTNGRHRKAGR